MWMIVALIVISILMVALAPKPKIENARPAKLGDFQFPRSQEGDPVPWFLGTVKMKSPNSLWFGDFVPVPVIVKQSTGMFSSKKVITGYLYKCGLDLGWALGGEEGCELLRIWADTDVIFTGNVTTESSITINKPNLFGGKNEGGGLVGIIDYYPGTFTQTANAYLQSKADPDCPAYVGQCHMVFRALPSILNFETGFYWGKSTNIKPIHAEFRKLAYNIHPTYSVMPNGFDVNPMELLYVALTQKFGMLSVDPNKIDMVSWLRDAETLYNEDLGMSLLVQSSLIGKDIAEEVARIADLILYQDVTTGKIVSKLIRNDYVIAELLVLDESNIQELRNFSKTTWDGTYNQCRITITDRAEQYAKKVSISQDFALINYQQKVRNTDITMPGCFVSEQANRLATRQLSTLSVPLFTIEILCNRIASSLKPGDVFVFNWAPYGLSNMVMRVQKVDLGTLIDGMVTINAIQDLFAVATAVFSAPGATGWTPVISALSPIANEALFELPYQLVSVDPSYLATLGSTVNATDLGYRVYSGFTTGDSNLIEKDAVFEVTPTATITSAYPYTQAVDNTGFAISSTKLANLIPATVSDDIFNSGGSIALIRSGAGDELIAYKSFTDILVNNITRGVYGSVPLNHPSGAKIYFISYGYGLENEQEPYTVFPKTVYAKLATFNTKDELALTALTELSTTVVGKSIKPDVCGKVRINGTNPLALGTVTGAFVLTYAHRNRLDTTIRSQDDVSVEPETNQHYNIRIYNNSTNALLASALDTSAVYATCRLSANATLRIEITAVKDGLESYATQKYLVTYNHGSETLNEILPDEDSIIFDGGGA